MFGFETVATGQKNECLPKAKKSFSASQEWKAVAGCYEKKCCINDRLAEY